jgi:hypothetical protein
VSAILEDLTMLSPKRLEKRLEALARDALPCRSVTVFDGSPERGLIVALHIDSRRRGDVLDLARVVEDDAAVSASCGWSLLTPNRRHSRWRLLLRVSFERPVTCEFSMTLDMSEHPSDPLRADLPLLLAASRFVLDFDGRLDPERPLVWIVAPAVRDCVLELVAQSAAGH